MLLPCIFVADIMTTEADVIACYILFYLLADGIATVGQVDIEWSMLLPQGRCYSHGSMILF